MRFTLTAQQTEIQALARSVADETLRPRAAARDRDETFPLEESRVLAANGLMGVGIPKQYGGLGLGPIEYALAVHEIAAGCAATAVTMAVTNMVGEMVERFGTVEQKERFLPPLTRGANPVGSFCLSEPHSGSDASALRAKATAVGDGSYVLDGSKMWVTSGAYCSVALIMARTSEHKSRGITTFLVECPSRGWVANKAEDKMGLRGSNTAAISLESCPVDAGGKLGEDGDGFKVAMTALDGGRVGIGAQSLGIAREAMHIAVRWVQENGGSQAQWSRVGSMSTRFEAAWAMVQRAAWLRAKGGRMTREAAMAKLFATESAGRICEDAAAVLGPEGLLWSRGVERALRDVRVTRIYEGTSEIQRLVIARELMRGSD